MKAESVDNIDVAISGHSRLALACADVGIDIKTYHRWKIKSCDLRKGPITTPANKLTEGERQMIVTVSNSKEYCDLAPCQIVPKLADEGIYIAGESSFYRVLKDMKMLEHRGKARPKSSYRPLPLTATRPNTIYSWDITFLRASVTGTFYYLYLFLDIFSRKIVGAEVHEKESMEHSSALIEKICLNENVLRDQLVLHSDNGSSMKGITMLVMLQRLGIVPSFSRPHVSDDNPFSESLFKTLKYCPRYPSKPFESLTTARAWVAEFVEWYNNVHLHSAIKFVTPNDRHEGRDVEILEKRKIVYEEAKLKNPCRWSGPTRNWEVVEEVHLNNLHKNVKEGIKIAA